MEDAPFADLSDDALVALIERLGEAERPERELHDALGELYRRLRTRAEIDELLAVRAVIDRLKQVYDDGDDSGGMGVREPRRQPPDAGGDAVGLAA